MTWKPWIISDIYIYMYIDIIYYIISNKSSMGSNIHMACRREQKTPIDTHNMSTCQRSFKITGPARTSEGVVVSSTGQKQSVPQGWIPIDPHQILGIFTPLLQIPMIHPNG